MSSPFSSGMLLCTCVLPLSKFKPFPFACIPFVTSKPICNTSSKVSSLFIDTLLLFLVNVLPNVKLVSVCLQPRLGERVATAGSLTSVDTLYRQGEAHPSWDCKLQWAQTHAEYKRRLSEFAHSPTASWGREVEQGKMRCQLFIEEGSWSCPIWALLV